MQAKIEEHPGFDSKIENNPIELLEAIKVLMQDSVRAVNPMIPLLDTMSRFVNIKQQENEYLLDYMKQFKQARDVLKSH